MEVIADPLQAVQQHAGVQAAALSTEAVAARKQSIAAASLTKTFDALRALFGPAGPAVRPHTQARPCVKGVVYMSRKCSSLVDDHVVCFPS